MLFTTSSAVTPVGSGRFAVTAEPSWFQGPGVYGGLTAAWLVRAMTAVVDAPDRALRELSGQFCARVRAGPAEVEAWVVRRGLHVSFARAELRQRDRVAATATAVFSATRPNALSYADLPPPPVTPVADAAPWTLPGGLPAYTQHFELRHCWGSSPLDGQPHAESGVWVRPRAPEAVDAPLAVALLDCFAPALFTRVPERRDAGTVAWSVHVLASLPHLPTAPDAFHLLGVRSDVAAAGYSSEDDALWAPDGTLLARARQLVAVI